MMWVLRAAGIGAGLGTVIAVLALWWDAAAHRKAERRRVSEYLAKLANDD